MFSRISRQYEGSSAIVIGAGGIGGAIIRLLASHAARLVVGDRDPSLLAEVKSTGGAVEMHTHEIDVSDWASVTEFFTFVNGKVGVPKYLFQNSPEEVAELALFVAAHGRFTGEDLGMGGGAGLGG
jgi:NADP-dependent 3-hydroxy acid dehydrogenase YdfG